MDATKTLGKKCAVFGFYPDTEEHVEVDGHDNHEETPQDLPSFTPLIHLCEAISEGFSPTPRISALNLPLGVMIEVLDENLCNVIQGTLRLRARALVTFLADVVGHHELIEFAQPPVSIKVNAVSPEVPENFGVPPLGDYLMEMKFREWFWISLEARLLPYQFSPNFRAHSILLLSLILQSTSQS